MFYGEDGRKDNGLWGKLESWMIGRLESWEVLKLGGSEVLKLEAFKVEKWKKEFGVFDVIFFVGCELNVGNLPLFIKGTTQPSLSFYFQKNECTNIQSRISSNWDDCS